VDEPAIHACSQACIGPPGGVIGQRDGLRPAGRGGVNSRLTGLRFTVRFNDFCLQRCVIT
jgi:hypothetical protein